MTFIMGPKNVDVDDNEDDIGVDDGENCDESEDIDKDNHQEQCIQG